MESQSRTQPRTRRYTPYSWLLSQVTSPSSHSTRCCFLAQSYHTALPDHGVLFSQPPACLYLSESYFCHYFCHGREIELSISFCLFPFTFGTKIFAQMIPYQYLGPASVFSYVRINRSTKFFKIIANEVSRNMQIPLVGIDYIYYIF